MVCILSKYLMFYQCVQRLKVIRFNLSLQQQLQNYACRSYEILRKLPSSRENFNLFHLRVESKVTACNIDTSICCSLTEKIGEL